MISTSIMESQKRVYSQMVLLLMSFSGLFVISAQRINMSITLVEMVNWTAVMKSYDHEAPCPLSNYTSFQRKEPGKFVWGYQTQSQILACYFYGLAIGHWPAEFLALKLKAKWLLLLGMLMSSTCNFLTPLTAKSSELLLMFLQFVKAVGQSFVMPSLGVMVDSFVNASDIVTFMGYSATALPLGAFITILVSGIICQYDQYGWEYVFYLCGGLGVVWCICWIYLVSECCFPTPLIYGTEPESSTPRERPTPPYRDIFTSKHVWAFLLCSLATYWAYSFNLLLLPLYNKRVFQADIQWNYIVSSAPNLLQAFLFMATVLGSERLLEKQIVRSGHVRKFCIVTGFAVFSTCNVLLTFTHCSRGTAGFLNMLAYGFIGLNLAATSALPVDMSPNYAGVLSSTINTAGNLFGSLLPLLVGTLSETKKGIQHWNIVFYASVLIGYSAMILFLMFGPTRVEPWNEIIEGLNNDQISRNGYTDLFEQEPTVDNNEIQSGIDSSTTLTGGKK